MLPAESMLGACRLTCAACTWALVANSMACSLMMAKVMGDKRVLCTWPRMNADWLASSFSSFSLGAVFWITASSCTVRLPACAFTFTLAWLRVAAITGALACVISTLAAATFQVPTWPDSPRTPAFTSAVAPISTWPLEVVEITPPLPAIFPPCAKSVPLMVVFSSAWMLMVPALPLPVADTLTLAPASTVAVLVATTSTVPPPVSPRARVLEPALNVTWLADNIMRPPLLATMLALLPAFNTPLCLITPATKLSTAGADKMMSPPGACTAFLFSIKLRMVLGVVVMLASFLLLAKLRVMRSPAAITTVPICATTTPLLRTSGASKAT